MLYIAGPMTGLPELNYPAFHEAARRLRAAGIDVVSPAELNPVTCTPSLAMKNDLAAVCDADGIALLPGWERSKGAAIEIALATYLKKTVWVIRANFILEILSVAELRAASEAPC